MFIGTSLITTLTGLTYTLTGLTQPAYSFSVKAKDAAGNISASSNKANLTTAAPAVDTNSNGSNQLNSLWNHFYNN
jgi:hypothetical protein